MSSDWVQFFVSDWTDTELHEASKAELVSLVQDTDFYETQYKWHSTGLS